MSNTVEPAIFHSQPRERSDSQKEELLAAQDVMIAGLYQKIVELTSENERHREASSWNPLNEGLPINQGNIDEIDTKNLLLKEKNLTLKEANQSLRDANMLLSHENKSLKGKVVAVEWYNKQQQTEISELNSQNANLELQINGLRQGLADQTKKINTLEVVNGRQFVQLKRQAEEIERLKSLLAQQQSQ